jgi:hypothetical protein
MLKRIIVRAVVENDEYLGSFEFPIYQGVPCNC